MRAAVYVDAFNLYYGALRGTPYRWLDLGALCRKLLPSDEVIAIKYYTAIVRSFGHDPQQPIRQQMYLRALRTIPNLSIHYGHFLVHRVQMRLAASPATFVDVLKAEEKGSDVNLATHLLHDAHRGFYEIAVVISNDSDLAEPIRVVRHELGRPVGVFTPATAHPSRVLERDATFFKSLRRSALAACQFQNTLHDAQGVFRKPGGW